MMHELDAQHPQDDNSDAGIWAASETYLCPIV